MALTNAQKFKLPVRNTSLTDQVYCKLCEMLLSGDFAIDERTSIRELAALSGTSTMPIREAVGRLVAQGALVIEPNKAVTIPKISALEFIDLTNIRILTETETIKRVTPLVDNQLLDTLEMIQEVFEKLVAEDEKNLIVKQNKIFHFTIYEAAKSPTLLKIINMNWLRAGPLINHDIGMITHEQRCRCSAKMHRQIIDSLTARNTEAACHFLKCDMLSAAKFILKNLMDFHNVEEIKWT